MNFVQEYPTSTFTQITKDTPFIVEHRNGEPDVRWPTSIVLTMSEEELASIKVYPFTPFVAPEGSHTVGDPIFHRDGDGNVIQTFSTEQDAVPVPTIISDRQFFQAIALMGVITQQEALDAVRTGTIPAQMQLFVDAISDPIERFSATMLLSGAIEFRRDHPMSLALMNANGWSAQQADDLWRFAATL